MQYIGYLMFVIGAAGVDGDDMIKSALICFAGLVVLAVSAWRERRKQYDTAGIKSKRNSGNVPNIRKQGLRNNKAA